MVVAHEFVQHTDAGVENVAIVGQLSARVAIQNTIDCPASGGWGWIRLRETLSIHAQVIDIIFDGRPLHRLLPRSLITYV